MNATNKSLNEQDKKLLEQKKSLDDRGQGTPVVHLHLSRGRNAQCTYFLRPTHRQWCLRRCKLRTFHVFYARSGGGVAESVSWKQRPSFPSRGAFFFSACLTVCCCCCLSAWLSSIYPLPDSPTSFTMVKKTSFIKVPYKIIRSLDRSGFKRSVPVIPSCET